MNTVLIAWLFLINALFMPLIVELVKERSPVLALWVIRLAVRALPRAHRDRYCEEWTAELDEMERQNVSQLVSSLRILLGAPSMGWFLRVQDRRQLACGGDYRDWILGLTMRSRNTIDAVSLSTRHVDDKCFDGGLWVSDFGQRYLDFQQDAIRRKLVVRRILVIDREQANQANLLHLCRLQMSLGICMRVLDQSTMPDTVKSLISDFVVFDSAISCEVTPTPDGMHSTTVKARLVLQPDQVTARIRQFEDFWSAAREVG